MSELSSPPIAPRKQNMEKWDLSQPCTFPCALLSGILIRNSLNTWVWAGSGLLLCWVPAHPAAAAWRWRCCGEKGVIFGKEHLFPCGLFGAAPLGCGNGEPEGGSGCVLCWCPNSTIPPCWQQSIPLSHPIPGAAPCPEEAPGAKGSWACVYLVQ